MKKNNKKNRLYPMKNIFIFGIIVILLISAVSTSQIDIKATTMGSRGIEWDAAINFDEPGGESDYLIFGEAPDANDGPPEDSYDMPKPPSPPYPPYIRSWFDDGLGGPYTQLLKDYRFYPDTHKTWNLSIQWVPSDYSTPTTITISWNTIDIDNSEYDIVFLCDNAGSPLTDMLVNNNYVFTCPANTPQNFKIICGSNQDPIANDDYPFVSEDSTDNQIDALDNDYDPDFDDLEIISVTNPPHGSAYTDGDYIYYTPDPEYNGADEFDYTIDDGNGGTDTATVYVTVTGVNDDPVANDDYAVVQESSTDNQIDVLDNDYDIDGDDLEIIEVTTPAHGNATHDGDYVYYTPQGGYSGSDTFDYTITDNNGSTGVVATVHITIIENSPPETPCPPSGSTFGYFNIPYEYLASTTDPDEDQIYYMFYWGDGTCSDWIGPYESGDCAAASHTWTVGDNYEVKVKAKDVYDAESDWSDSIMVHIAAPALQIRQINGGLSKVSARIKNNGDAPASQVNWSISVKGGMLALIDAAASGTISSLNVGEEAIIDSDDASIVGFGLVDITVTAETAGAPIASENVKGLVLLYIVFIISW
jgi:hypothetical protein